MKIPDFKTYLKESHWSEMNRRSQGIVKRKEEYIDVDSLSPKEMYDHLKKTYKSLTSNNVIGYTAAGHTHYVKVNVTENCTVNVEYEVRKETLIKELKIWFANFYVSDDVLAMNKRMVDKLKTRYRVNDTINLYVYIRPKTGKRTNTVVIDLINYILNNTEDKPAIEKI